MTGHQQNPGTGFTLMGKEVPEVDIRALCKSIGVKDENIITVNPNHLDQDKCRNCKMCVKTGCPALISTKEQVVIDYTSCNGCTVCKQVCPFDAIEEVTR